jgi:repressor of nif and glnA expression
MLRADVTDTLKKTLEVLGGLVITSNPSSPLLGMSPAENYGAVSAFGGEILISAIEEAGIPTHTNTVYSTLDFSELEPVTEEIKGELIIL